jgi:hypothetical protein
MSNSILTPDNIATLAATLVGQDLGLASLVHRDVEKDFGQGTGATVKIRVPGAVPARTRDIDSLAPLTSDSIAEQSIPVTLSTEAYSLVPLSDGDLDLNIEDYAKQVLLPQTQAIVKFVERDVVAAMKATPTSAITYSSTTPAKAFTAIRRQLRDSGVSTEAKLFAAVGSGIYGDLLDAPVGTWDENGKMVRGNNVIESTRLGAKEIVAFVPEAFALVVRAPMVPSGAPYGASVKDGDFALRLIRSYDTKIAADTSLVTAFVGVQALPLAVDNEDGTVSLVEHGGAVRVVVA